MGETLSSTVEMLEKSHIPEADHADELLYRVCRVLPLLLPSFKILYNADNARDGPAQSSSSSGFLARQENCSELVDTVGDRLTGKGVTNHLADVLDVGNLDAFLDRIRDLWMGREAIASEPQ